MAAKKAPSKKASEKRPKKGIVSTGVTPDSVPRRCDNVLSRRNYDGTVSAMRLDNDKYFYNINGIAAEVWNLIDGVSTVGVIKEKLEKKHTPPERRFERDLSKFLEELVREKLILL